MQSTTNQSTSSKHFASWSDPVWDGPSGGSAKPSHTTIVEPAVQLSGGRIFVGPRRVYDAFAAAEPRERIRPGFLTSEGRFVNPFTAATLARAAGQAPNGVAWPKVGLLPSDLSCPLSENEGESRQ